MLLLPATIPDRKKSKYGIEETHNGCIVFRDGGLEVEVKVSDTYLWVDRQRLGVYDFRRLVDNVAHYFADNMFSTKATRQDAAQMIARALNRRLHVQWERLLPLVPPECLELQRLMWASTLKDCTLLHYPELYDNPRWKDLKTDLRKYHACRLLVKYNDPLWVVEGAEGREAHLIEVSSWREHYRGGRSSTKAINKTLDKLPRGISYDLVSAIARLPLERPIVGRLHVLFAASCAEHHRFAYHWRAVMRADGTMVKEAARVVGWDLRPTSKSSTIREAAWHIMDYPEEYGGDLVGLAERSREWHVNQPRYIDYQTKSIPPMTSLAEPPIDVNALALEGIRWLATAGDCYNESDLMHHCVASYVEKARDGHCFLFHVEDNGQMATVEVSAQGVVLQAKGPHNQTNKACDIGERRLELAFRRWRDLNRTMFEATIPPVGAIPL